MAKSYLSKNIGFEIAKDFVESFTSLNQSNIGYVFFGKHTDYENLEYFDDVSETPIEEKKIWDNIFALKKITGTNVNLVLRRNDWQENKIYNQYDDTIAPNEQDDNFYVTVLDDNTWKVYKCLCNNKGGISTYKPTGDYTVNKGIIDNDDGYIWKYMFGVDKDQFSEFISSSYIPITTLPTDSYNSTVTSLVDGAIYSIVITNPGTGYVNSFQTVFPSGSEYLSDVDEITFDDFSNIAVNMGVSGYGIPSGTYVKSINLVTQKIKLSQKTTASGSSLFFYTRAVISGDGDDATASVEIVDGSINKIPMVTYGDGYSKANVYIYGTGSDAEARAILTPKFGHGFNPAKELSANSAMVSIVLKDDETSTNNEIRQVGVVKDLHKYGKSTILTTNEAVLVADQTYTLTLTSGSSYNLDEIVYQGSSLASSNFSGYVYDQTETTVKLTGVKGTFTLASPLKGADSSVSRVPIAIANPYFQPYVGNIIYVKNEEPVQRNPGQDENYKFIFRF